ncbi:FliH/SctL family protein [Tissierella sp. Yu-01]|uniref:FliH/SctL family protein n=1 Tax=Tissierella sp. Yu-01 TaxID=3035694 RepID=UPI00240D0A5C|nr:FliH/SctL family protein [Tissierella sp. Yu-01]WFA07899.1 FliH/SctL family protein [Tissierella sp. Yu-01]
MRLSYRIIKNDNVAYSDSSVSISDVKIKAPIIDEEPEEIIEEAIEDGDKDNQKSYVDIEAIRKEIEEKLRLEMEEERQALIEASMNEAKAEIKNLQREAIEKAYEEGIKRGFEDGHKQGIEKAFEDCQEQCNEIKKNALDLIEQAERKVKEYFLDNRDRILNLAGEMAESIVHDVIDTSSKNITSLIKPIIQLYEETENIIITCNPDNVEILRENLEELEASCPKARFIILEDNNLEKNGCTIENEAQIIDLQIRKQIDSIIDEMKNMED